MNGYSFVDLCTCSVARCITGHWNGRWAGCRIQCEGVVFAYTGEESIQFQNVNKDDALCRSSSDDDNDDDGRTR